jgi:hypothetical protein
MRFVKAYIHTYTYTHTHTHTLQLEEDARGLLAKTMHEVRQGISKRGDDKGVLSKCIKWELEEKLHVTF